MFVQTNIEKDDIYQVINAMIKRWSKNRLKNGVVIAGAHAFKLGIKSMDKDKFNELWLEMVGFTNDLLAFQEMKRLENEQPKTSEFVKIFCDKILSEEHYKEK